MFVEMSPLAPFDAVTERERSAQLPSHRLGCRTGYVPRLGREEKMEREQNSARMPAELWVLSCSG